MIQIDRVIIIDRVIAPASEKIDESKETST
jgi:hypothetical protein